MGKLKKGFNRKARQNAVVCENQTPAKVNVDIDIREDKYDESNVFALPSQKQKIKKVKSAAAPQQKRLSKKQRRKLAQVIKKGVIRQNRKQLFEELHKVQATSEELRCMTSVSEAQTLGVRRFKSSETIKSNKVIPTKNTSTIINRKRKINSIKGSNKKRAKNKENKPPTPKKESSSSDDSDSDLQIHERLQNNDGSSEIEISLQTELSGNRNIIVQHNAEMGVDLHTDEGKCGENSVVVPSSSEKKKIKSAKDKPVIKENLSKQQRKKQKQLKLKKSKRKRKQLFEELHKVQATSEELRCMTSVSEAQTLGVRRFKSSETIKSNKVIPTKNTSTIINRKRKINSIKGSNKKRAKNKENKPPTPKKESSSSDDSDSDLQIHERLQNNDGSSEIEISLQTELSGNRNIIVQHNAEMGVDLHTDEGKCGENSVVVPSSSEKKKIKSAKDKPVIKENLSKQQRKKQKQLKLKKSKRKIDVCEDKCDENNDILHISKVKNTKNMKNKSITQIKHSKQETEKTDKQKKTKRKKRNQDNGNLEEAESTKELVVTLLSNDQMKDAGRIEENTRNTQASKVPAKHIPVLRTEEIEKARSALPILSEEHTIMDAIRKNLIVVICGETGCGKTTQIPQFLYEAGYASEGRIGITEPRRLAASAMSWRVAYEMNLNFSEVSYKIRYEGNVTPQTKIKFMTDGVLLREIKNDAYLSKYQAIVIDEAHERTMQSDVLIGLLSLVVKFREKKGKPLKLIIMSATLRLEDFVKNKRLFNPPPPVIKIEGRQHPVTVLFNKQTPVDYISEAYRKVCKIHRTNRSGGILVFVTGQEEVNALCRKLKKTFPLHDQRKNFKTEKSINSSNQEAEEDKQLNITLKWFKKRRRKDRFEVLPNIRLDDYCAEADDDEDAIDRLSEGSDNNFVDSDYDDDELSFDSAEPLYVLPLYSMLPSNQQAKVFEPPPPGHRLCVISTNVAETSLTVPNIKYVVDTGRVKRRMYDKMTSVSTFIVTWISKASAEQRTGRAGRTSLGCCYRLYSSAVYDNDFPDFFEPEIIQRPIDDIVLQLKSMGISKVVDFPLPSPPDVESIKGAEERLVHLGALEKHLSDAKKREWSSTITSLGSQMACISISPRYSKMIVSLIQQNDCSQKGVMPYMITVVAALTVREVWIDSYGTAHTDEKMKKLSEMQKKWKNLRLSWTAEGESRGLGDIMTLLEPIGIVENKGGTPDICYSLGLRYQAVVEIRKLRKQLTNEVNLFMPELELCVDPNLSAPTDIQMKCLRQTMLSGMMDHVARKIPAGAIKLEDKWRLKYAYECLEIEQPVFIHPTSIVLNQNPEFVIYQEIIESSKHYMKIVSAIEPSWLPMFCQCNCTFSEPLDNPPPRYDRKNDKILCHLGSTYGWRKWPIEPVEMVYPRNDEISIKWFAQFFLEGEVCTSLKTYSTKLISKPSVIAKKWARFISRVNNLLNAFIRYRIDSKKLLQEVWDKNPKYLLKEYCDLLPESFLYEVSEKWPPS